MRERAVFVIAFIAICGCLLAGNGCLYRHHNAACKERAAALQARREHLEQNAHEKLKIGTKKADIVRFFAENNFPVTFSATEASGSITGIGCAPSGCGTDDYILGISVRVDQAGTVIGEPVVGGIYTNCL